MTTFLSIFFLYTSLSLTHFSPFDRLVGSDRRGFFLPNVRMYTAFVLIQYIERMNPGWPWWMSFGVVAEKAQLRVSWSNESIYPTFFDVVNYIRHRKKNGTRSERERERKKETKDDFSHSEKSGFYEEKESKKKKVVRVSSHSLNKVTSSKLDVLLS